MADWYAVSADCQKSRGKSVERKTLTVRERDSEVIPAWQKHLMFDIAADRAGFVRVSPCVITAIAAPADAAGEAGNG